MAIKKTTTYTPPIAPTFNAGTFGTNIMSKVTGVAPKVTGPVAGISLPVANKTTTKATGGVVNNVGAPQYTPKSGVGTKQGNYTYTQNGWQTPSTGGPNGVLLGSTQNTPVYGPKPVVNTSTGGSTTKTTTANPNYSPTIQDMGGASYGGSPTAGANYGTTTGTNYGAGTTTTGKTGGMATAGDLVNGASYSDGLTNEERDLQRALQERQQYLDELRNQDTNESSVMNNVLRQFQGEIDATNRVYADKLAEAKITGRNRIGMDRAENFNSGATNSSFANASADRVLQYNDQQYSAIENEKLARIMEIQNNARTLGQKFLADKKASKEAGYTEYINNLNSTKTLKDTIVNKLATNILNSDIDINTIKGADLTTMATNSGTTVQAIKSAYQTLKKANDIAIAEQKMELVKQLPASAQEYEYAKQGGYKGSYNDYQNLDANRKVAIARAGVSNSGLTPNQVNSTVNQIAGALDNEPIIKAYNTVQEGYNTIKTIGVDTKSPADDIAFIYAFAKIMDPNSVVREGEYNTIQKYAQTWADNFGFKAKRIFSNTNFLTPAAKQNMLTTLQPKVTTITNQATNLKNEYQRQINDAYAGKQRQITNYSIGNEVSNKTNTTFDPSKHTPNYTKDIQDAKNAVANGANATDVRNRLLLIYKDVPNL